MGGVPFYEVGIVTVDRTDEDREGLYETGREASLRCGGFLGEFKGEVEDAAPTPIAIDEKDRLHLRGQFASVGRFGVRYHNRFS